jgi:hydrophobic/amphiphilic exporter-1 (mainly G- bacteria), HAE1 family
MSIVDLSIKRPVLITMFLLVFVLFGAMAYFKLPLSLIPDVKLPIVTVQVIYPGAGPQVIESQITKRIEDEVSALSQLDTITSYSIEGASIVTIQFKIGKDENLAKEEVKEKIDAILDKLPSGARTPTIAKLDITAMFPTMNILIEGEVSPTTLRTLADKVVKDKLSQVEGVGKVDVGGGREREIRVEVGAPDVFDRSVPLTQIAGILQAANVEIPGGSIQEEGLDLSARLKGQFQSVDEIRDLDIPTRSGVVKLRQIADVSDSNKDVKERISFFDVAGDKRNEDAVLLKIIKNPSANTVSIVEKVTAILPGIEKELGGDLHLRVVSEDATYVRDSVSDTLFNVLLSVAITALVLLFFLHDLRSTLIVVIAMPFSLIATFWVMQLLGLSLNILSLMGLATATGILVSDAVIVLENIFRHKALGESREEAASKGSREVMVAVVAATLTHVAVFIPMANMSGMMGRAMGDFAYTIVAATLFSLLMCFTLTPMMASRFLPEKAREPGPLGRTLELMFSAWERGYARMVAAIVGTKRSSALAVAATFAALVASLALALASALKLEILPLTDGGKVQIIVDLPLGSDLGETSKAMKDIESRVSGYREVASVLTDLGKQSDMDTDVNLAKMDVQLVPKAERKRSNKEIASAITETLSTVPGATIKVSSVSEISFGGGGASPINFSLQGADNAVLLDLTTKMSSALREIPGLVNVNASVKPGKTEIDFEPDRRRIADDGLTVQEVALSLRSAVDGLVLTTYREGGDEYDIRVSLKERDLRGIDDLGNIPVVSPRGTFPLSRYAKLSLASGSNRLTHTDKVPSVIFSADLLPGATQSEAQAAIDAKIAAMNMPAGYIVKNAGMAQVFQETIRDLIIVFVLAVVIVFMILAATLENFRQPLIILGSVPLALVGVILSVAMTGVTINMFAMLAVVMLIGLAVTNAILILEYSNQLRAEGKGVAEALVTASKAKLRPILMSNIAIILSLMPMALGVGASGAELRAPMGVITIGGVVMSTILSLFLIPALEMLTTGRRRSGERAAVKESSNEA